MATLDSLRVREYMSTKLVTFTPDMDVMSAINALVTHRIAGAPVLDAAGKLVGMLSERDCLTIGLTASQDTCIAGPVSQFMATKVVSVDPEATLMQLAAMFVSASYRRYPVMQGDQLVGLISRSDVLRAINTLC